MIYKEKHTWSKIDQSDFLKKSLYIVKKLKLFTELSTEIVDIFLGYCSGIGVKMQIRLW